MYDHVPQETFSKSSPFLPSRALTTRRRCLGGGNAAKEGTISTRCALIRRMGSAPGVELKRAER